VADQPFYRFSDLLVKSLTLPLVEDSVFIAGFRFAERFDGFALFFLNRMGQGLPPRSVPPDD